VVRQTLTNSLRGRDVPRFVSATEDFARRQPALFVAGAAALGVLLARVLMSPGKAVLTALVGLGLGWLLLTRRTRSSPSQVHPDLGYTPPRYGSDVYGAATGSGHPPAGAPQTQP
jgi:hypothetical protein